MAGQAPPEPESNGSPPRGAVRTADPEIESLRRLLFGDEWARVAELSRRIGTPDGFAAEVSKTLARAIVRASGNDKRLRAALQPSVEESLRIFARRDPKTLATILFPAIGGAIRKSISASIHGLIESLNATIEQSFSLRGLEWRLEAWRTGRPIGAIVLAKSRLFRVEQVFLIHRASGALLCQRSAPGARGADPAMVSGMLTAISDFVSDSFGGEAEDQELGSIQVDDLRVWIVNSPRALLAAVVRGSAPYEMFSRLRAALEEIHARLPEALLSFRDDTAAFEAAGPILENCLLGRGAPGGAGKGMGKGIVLAAAAVILAAALGVWWHREGARWRALTKAIESQPGIAVTEARMGRWGPGRIAGLRDPLAADPGVLAAEAGYAPTAISFHWRPFLSLDPPIQAAREIESIRETLASKEVLFDVGSVRIPAHQRSVLIEITSAARRLANASAALGGRWLVEIRGEADPTGTPAGNAVLAEARAAEVAGALEALGVDRSLLRRSRSGADGGGRVPRATFRVVAAGQ